MWLIRQKLIFLQILPVLSRTGTWSLIRQGPQIDTRSIWDSLKFAKCFEYLQIFKYLQIFLPVAQMVKNLPAMWETCVWSLGQKNPLEKGMATHFSTLPGEFHGQRSLVGYSPGDRRESDMIDRVTLTLNTYRYINKLGYQGINFPISPWLHLNIFSEWGLSLFT